jgi:hypothetical protein
MTNNDLKIYALNSIAMAVSFSNLEAILKILLLCVSIVYTIMKTIELIKGKKGNDNKTDNS